MEVQSKSEISHLSENDITDRVHFLAELLHCHGNIFLSKYNLSGTLNETNATNMIFDTMLRSTSFLSEAIKFGEDSDKPLVITADIGLMWAIIFQKNDEHQILQLHALGPVFSTALSEDSINRLQKRTDIREKWKPKFISYLKAVPVLPAIEFFKYTLMLHYSVNNEYLKPSDITFSGSIQKDVPLRNQKGINFTEYWARENNLIRIIQTGDVYYKNKISSASSILQDLYPSSDSELEEIKQFASIFLGLCIRAAIDGGISPDTAYIRGNVYIKNITSVKSFADVLSICHSGFEDFLFQVHNHLGKPSYSGAINSCIDFIQSHIDEPLNIDYLASRFGYTKYYLSKKFKAEVGISINSYIKKARISRASYLLVSTKMDIQEISDLLHFGNRNFFTKVFKEEMGINPATFKENHKKHL